MSVGKSAAEKERSESDRAACFAWHTIVRDQWAGERAYTFGPLCTGSGIYTPARATRTLPINNRCVAAAAAAADGTNTYLYASGSGNFFFGFFSIFFLFFFSWWPYYPFTYNNIIYTKIHDLYIYYTAIVVLNFFFENIFIYNFGTYIRTPIYIQLLYTAENVKRFDFHFHHNI